MDFGLPSLLLFGISLGLMSLLVTGSTRSSLAVPAILGFRLPASSAPFVTLSSLLRLVFRAPVSL